MCLKLKLKLKQGLKLKVKLKLKLKLKLKPKLKLTCTLWKGAVKAITVQLPGLKLKLTSSKWKKQLQANEQMQIPPIEALYIMIYNVINKIFFLFSRINIAVDDSFK